MFFDGFAAGARHFGCEPEFLEHAHGDLLIHRVVFGEQQSHRTALPCGEGVLRGIPGLLFGPFRDENAAQATKQL